MRILLESVMYFKIWALSVESTLLLYMSTVCGTMVVLLAQHSMNVKSVTVLIWRNGKEDACNKEW